MFIKQIQLSQTNKVAFIKFRMGLFFLITLGEIVVILGFWWIDLKSYS